MAVPLTRGDDRRVGMLMRSPLFEIALVLVGLDHVASHIVNTDHRLLQT
jgi:hypothetical protein